jgi:hypothetical protein
MTASSSLTWVALLDGLRATPVRLRALLAEAAAEGVRWHEADARAVCEVMAHLCTVESPFRARLVRITLQENPSVAAIADHMTGGYDLDAPAAILLDTFSELRAGTIAFLENLPAAARARAAMHAETGPTTLRDQVEALLGHDEAEVKRLAELFGSRR